jgi:glutathione S-transferase
MAAYKFYYWPTIQGRGELVRLALEEAGVDYDDVARGSDDVEGSDAMSALMDGEGNARPPFAPPFLKLHEVCIGQTANILLYLGEHHGLAPGDTAGRLWTHQLQLTIADFVAEVHEAHHPIATSLYYEDQKREAKRRAKDFRDNRAPKFLGYFERILERNPEGPKHLVGNELTYVDLSLFQVVAGMRYAFPRLMRRLGKTLPYTMALHDAVARRPRIAAYLASSRRIRFNRQGIFRHYPELDDPARPTGHRSGQRATATNRARGRKSATR